MLKRFYSLHCTLSSNTQNQITALLCCPMNEVTLHFMEVQKQARKTDFGLFAVAFANCLSL